MTDVSVQTAGNTAYIGTTDENGLYKYLFFNIKQLRHLSRFSLFSIILTINSCYLTQTSLTASIL